MSRQIPAEHFGMTPEEYDNLLSQQVQIEYANRKHAEILKMLSDHALVSTGLYIEGEDTYSCLKCEFTCGHPGQFNEHLIRLLKGVKYGPRKVFQGASLSE